MLARQISRNAGSQARVARRIPSRTGAVRVMASAKRERESIGRD
jgi:hypothetical protein